MKKKITILLILTIITLLLASCGNINKTNKSQEDKPDSVIKEFIVKMYKLDDYKKVNIEKLNIEYPKDKYTNELRKATTEKALTPFINDRMQLSYIMNCCNLHINSKVISTSIYKYTSEKDGSLVYNFDGKTKLTFVDKNKQKEEDVSGQLTVKKINNKWTIVQINRVDIENVLKYRDEKYK